MGHRERNPLGVDLNFNNLLFLGGAIFLLTTDAGKKLTKALFNPTAKRTGKGPAKPGGGEGTDLPSTEFTISRVDGANALIALPGAHFNMTIVLQHVGPSGKYVAGINLAYGDLLSILRITGLPTSPGEILQTAVNDFEVGNDSNPKTYRIPVSLDYIGSPSALIFVQAFVRDYAGNVLKDMWTV